LRIANRVSPGKDGSDAAALVLWFLWAEPHFEDLHYLDEWELSHVVGPEPGLKGR
jgi:hypothetical protein